MGGVMLKYSTSLNSIDHPVKPAQIETLIQVVFGNRTTNTRIPAKSI
jgi:hypothetical protein